MNLLMMKKSLELVFDYNLSEYEIKAILTSIDLFIGISFSKANHRSKSRGLELM